MAGRNDNKNAYESSAAKLKDKLGYSSLQRSEDRLKLADQDVIHVGQTAILVEILAQAPSPVANQSADADSHCIECGASMPNPTNNKRADLLCVDDFICHTCKASHEQARRPARSVNCCDCGCDVTKQANSDGKADELKSIALYLCPACAKKRISGSLPVERIKDYRLLTQLGEGGFGMVFLAWHDKTNRAVALKITKEVIKDDPALVKRFKREIAVMQRLKHPNLVRLLDEGIAESGNYFFISEYLPAGSLTDYTWKNFDGILPVAKACQIYSQALEGLAFLHGKGYIHRDIKPENIILTKDSSGKRIAKLGDFGLAKNYLVHGGTLTGANEWIGTIFYCPPEQILDFKHSSPASDLYAMGIAFYNSVTGQFPYDFPSREECARMVRRGERPRDPISFILGDNKPIPIEKRLPGIDAKVARAVNGAIEKEVKKRLGIAEFAKALAQ